MTPLAVGGKYFHMTTNAFEKLTEAEKEIYRKQSAKGGKACRGEKKRLAGMAGFRARVKKIRAKLAAA